jgi:hypothetical protein
MFNISTILNEYYAKSSDEKVQILTYALDYMQQHSGRSKSDCIAMALGYVNTTGEVDTWEKY